ncbi:MAG: DegV family EDD domain-containing protein [Anaerolineales bacterium]|nr:DegV family EDD domain-containing protein [Anaerolineales bacterium]
MSKVCILTDNTAQFTQSGFTGEKLVKRISPELILTTGTSDQSGLYNNLITDNHQILSPQEFLNQYNLLSKSYDGIIVITQTASLSQAAKHAAEAKAKYAGRAHVQIIDSQTTSVGLGWLVQVAAHAAEEGADLVKIERVVRSALKHIYTMFCIPDLTYLSEAGYLTHSQAIVGEMLGLFPMYTLEDGNLSPMSKVRTQRHLQESFQEFVEEFNHPKQIGLIKSTMATYFKTRPFRQYMNEKYPEVPFAELEISSTLSVILGPQCAGLIIMDSLK